MEAGTGTIMLDVGLWVKPTVVIQVIMKWTGIGAGLLVLLEK